MMARRGLVWTCCNGSVRLCWLLQNFNWLDRVRPPKKLGRRLIALNAVLFGLFFGTLIWLRT
jgi:hypothetical protein